MTMAITDLVAIPSNINPGVSPARQQTMLALLGNPRGSYSQECQPITHPNLSALCVTKSVGSFRVTGLKPAVESLKAVVGEIAQKEAEVHGGLGTAGMLCVRLVRGSQSSISNHAWGTAVDLTLNGRLDRRGDNLVMTGLVQIAPIFNRHGWFWGAGFRTEDAMHFEVCDEKIREWHAAGRFGAGVRPAPPSMLSLGDRGPEVRRLQERLNQQGAGLVADGDYGRMTQAAVMSFQAQKGLTPDGVCGPATWAALGG